MRNILESIYYGNEATSARTFKPATRYVLLMEEASQLEDKLKPPCPMKPGRCSYSSPRYPRKSEVSPA